MALSKSYTILAQLSPVVNILTDLYSVPIGAQTIISTIFICNRNSYNIFFDLAFAPDGEADQDYHYLYSNQKLGPYLTFAFTTGPTMNGNDPTGDTIRVKATSSRVAFNVFGVELSQI